MQYVILARDRKQRKKHLKIMVFLLAVFSLLVGIVLTLKEQSAISKNATQENLVVLSHQDELHTNITPQKGNIFIQHITNLITQSTLSILGKDVLVEDQSATSYEDDLTNEDDEVEERVDTVNSLDTEELPAEAEKVLEDIVDVADQALRIQNQFSYTVAVGDKLRHVLEQSGLDASVASDLIKQYSSLAQLESGQQFYWVLDKDGELEYLNWLVSEKEERVYERQANGKFTYQKFNKKGEWKQDVVRGTIQNSFTASLKAVGLSGRQINQLAVGLQSQIATNKLKKRINLLF